MYGTVRNVIYNKGYGFIVPESTIGELFFHITQYNGTVPLGRGDEVYFEIGEGKNGKPIAINVFLVRKFSSEMDEINEIHELPYPKKHHSKPYYGKPTKTIDSALAKTARSVGGAVVGSFFGPVGAILGASLGLFDMSREISGTCLKCGGTGHVTAIDETYIGFQCQKCRRFWKRKNKDGLTGLNVKR